MAGGVDLEQVAMVAVGVPAGTDWWRTVAGLVLHPAASRASPQTAITVLDDLLISTKTPQVAERLGAVAGTRRPLSGTWQ
jgi:hypothetical protein